MSLQPQEDFEFVHDVFSDLEKHSKYHKYVSLHEYQDTVESGTLIRRLSETETGLVLGYRSEPEQIVAPFILEVFPKKDISLEFFRQIPAEILVEFVLGYAAKNTNDSLVKNTLKTQISQIRDLDKIDKIESLVEGLAGAVSKQEIVEDFVARLGNIVYSAALPYVKERYERKLSEDIYQTLQRTFSKKKQRLASSKTLDDYKHEYGTSSLSSDIEKLKKMLSNEVYSSLRDGIIKELELIIKKHTEEISDIINQLKFDELEELDDDEQEKFKEKDRLFKEEAVEVCRRQFDFTSLEIDQALRKAAEGFSLEQVTQEYMLEKFEERIAEYAKKEVVKVEDPARLVADLNNKYLKMIFSQENISEDMPTVCKNISPGLSSLVGESSLEKFFENINPGLVHEAVKEILEGVKPNQLLDESFLAKTYASALASILSGKIVKEKLLPVVATEPDALIDAYVHFKATHAAALRDNLFSKVQDVIYGEEFSFIVYSTTGAFINTGKKKLGGEREGPRKYTLLRLSDAVEVRPPSLETSIDIVYKLCDSLEHLQRKSESHRGITLNNILLSEDVYEPLIFGHNPERKCSPSCFSLPDTINQDLFAVASILYTLIEDKVPFHSSDPKGIKEDIQNKYFKRKARRIPKKILKLIGEVFNNSISNANYAISYFKQKLAKASGRFPSRSYYSFMDYINTLSEEHNKQINEKLGVGNGSGERN